MGNKICLEEEAESVKQREKKKNKVKDQSNQSSIIKRIFILNNNKGLKRDSQSTLALLPMLAIACSSYSLMQH